MSLVLSEYEKDMIRERGTFAINLIHPKARWDYDVLDPLPVHETILRPMLERATDCLVYGVETGSQIYAASSTILHPDRGRHRVALAGDPVTGHELLWNSYGGKRGSVVILTSPDDFPAGEIFPHCIFPHIIENYRSAHTPSAVRLARQHAAGGGVAVCLPRNNGIEWMDVFAAPEVALALFRRALRLCPLVT